MMACGCLFLFLGIAFHAFLWYFVLLQKVKYVNELLKELHDNFYEKLPAMQLKAEIERCHQGLIEKLDKPERKLVLQIIDCKEQITRICPSTALSVVSVWRGD